VRAQQTKPNERSGEVYLPGLPNTLGAATSTGVSVMLTLLRKMLLGSGLAHGIAVAANDAIAGLGDDLLTQSMIGIAEPHNVVGSG
jgi:hypothetical protein